MESVRVSRDMRRTIHEPRATSSAIAPEVVSPAHGAHAPARSRPAPPRYARRVDVQPISALLAAVLILGKEKGEPAEAAGTTTSQSAPPTTTNGGGGGGGTPAGNPTAGKAVFASAGCATCHTLKAANSHGYVGPNLDTLKPSYAKIVKQVTNGGAVMPAFKTQLTATQIKNVAAFVYASTHKK